MLLKTLRVGGYKTNCYLVADPETRDCAVVDPGAQVHTILQALDEDGLRLQAILLTHAHFDHFGAMWPLYDRRRAPVYVCEKDLAPIVNIGPQRFCPPPDTHFISDGERFMVGSLEFQVITCPGHTPGSVAFLCGDLLFSGDTLFHMECGCTSSACGSIPDMTASLAKLRALPGDYKLLPGHMDASTLSYEREHNPYLQPGLKLVGLEEDDDFMDFGKI